MKDLDVIDETRETSARPPTTGVSLTGLRAASTTLLPGTILLISLVALTWRASMPLTNPDTYFHLRFGQEFIDGWSLRDPGSPSSFGTNDWVPTQWLPQIAMARLEGWFGLPAVAWLQGLLHLCLAVTFWCVARRWATPMVSALVVACALVACSPALSMRPQVISYALVAVTTAGYLRSSEDHRARWWLVPVTWVWAMCHGMWPVGIVIGVVAVVGIAADRGVSRRELLRLAAVPLACAVAAALTPVGPRLYPAVVLVGGRGKYFAEWQPMHFTGVVGGALLLLLGVVGLRLVRRGVSTSWTEALLFGQCLAWAVYSTRTVAVAAAMLVPVAAHVYSGWRRPSQPPRRSETATVLVGAALCLAALAAVVPRTADEPPEEPSWANVVDELPPGTPVLNDWGKGGWMMWRWPELDFVMNGYGDIYTDAELARNFRMDGAGNDWVDDVRGTRTTYALVVPGSKLAYGLEIMHWKVLHRSSDLVMMQAPDDW